MLSPITDVKMIASFWRQRNVRPGQMARLLGQSPDTALLIHADKNGAVVMGASDKVAFASRMALHGDSANPKEQLEVLLTACATCQPLQSFFKSGEVAEFEIHGVPHVYRMRVSPGAVE